MSETAPMFVGPVPEIYDRLMVPLIFEPYADDLAARIAALAPLSVLETAAGTGAVTRAVCATLGPGTSYVATDLNQAMLDWASARQGAGFEVVWRQANALDLPFGDKAFDIVCCQFGMMFFDDRIRAFEEARRVLKPGGHFIFSTWDRIEENDFAHAAHETLGKIFEADPPQFMARTPHGHYDIDLIRAEVLAAGYSAIKVDEVSATSRADSPITVAVAFCQGTPMRGEIVARDAHALEAVTKAVSEEVERRFGLGPLSGRMKAFVFIASV